MNAKMIASALMATFVLMGGCLKKERSETEKAVDAARQRIEVLSTNQTTAAIWGTRRVREDLRKIESLKDRRELIAEWSDALSHMPGKGLSPSARYGVLREACRMLVWDVADALLEIGGTYDEVWNEYFKAIEWLDVQCAHMRALALETGGDFRTRRDRWSYYQALAEYREIIVENIELNRLDESRYPCDAEKMGTIRARFEKQIGRPVRRNEDVKHLGFYRRQVGVRIQKERDADLKKAASHEQ